MLTAPQWPCPLTRSHGLSDFQRYYHFGKAVSQEGGQLDKAVGIVLKIQLLKLEIFEI